MPGALVEEFFDFGVGQVLALVPAIALAALDAGQPPPRLAEDFALGRLRLGHDVERVVQQGAQRDPLVLGSCLEIIETHLQGLFFLNK